MYLLATICLLGFSSAQKVTKLTSCLTTENNLKMDCKFQKNAGSTATVHCQYSMGDKIIATTNLQTIVNQEFKNRANVIIIEGNTCRLNLTGLSDNSAKNYTCQIRQLETATKTVIVKKTNHLVKCSALSVLSSSSLLSAMMMLPLLLEVHWP